MAQADEGESFSPLERLRRFLVDRYGAGKGEEIYRAIKAANTSKPGHGEAIAVVDPKDISNFIQELLNDGVFGIGSLKLIGFDSFLQQQRHRHEAMMRFLKHYVQPEEYRALLASFTLVSILQDSTSKYRGGDTVGPLYERLNGLNYGRRILNLVSIGELQNRVYPQMRTTEARFVAGGRLPPASGEAEIVRQIFYAALRPDATRLWLTSQTDPAEAFDRIVSAVFDRDHPIPYLDVYGAESAWVLAKQIGALFVLSFGDFEVVVHDQTGNPNAGYIRIQKKAH